MLDAFTLRVAFGLVAVCVLALTYFVIYRGTRSAYSGWWCLSLLAFGPGGLLFLLNGTAAQAVANPLGNAVVVLGAVFVLAACRALSGRRLPPWVMVVAPLVVLVPALLDDPGTDVWPAGTVYLAAMAALLVLACRELVDLVARLERADTHRADYRGSVVAMAVVSGLLALFYAGRTVAFVTVGPEHPFFTTWFGTQAACLVVMVLLVVASSSLSALSYGYQTLALRERAARDPLTGVFNRDGLAEVVGDLRRGIGPGTSVAVVVADLDRFKGVNDAFGHQAGDEALIAFAQACRDVLGDRGVVGRLGGDEFLLVLLGMPVESTIAAIDRHYRADDPEGRKPTVSYGIADLAAGEDAMAAVGRADRALYRAKAEGRDRAVRHQPEPPGGRA